MILKTLSALACVIALLGLTVKSPAQTKKEVRSKLFKQVLADYSDVRECVEKEEGGARAAEENMSVEEVDVNRDGVPEYEVSLAGPCACGMANCLIQLYRQSPAGYELILEDASGFDLSVLKTSTRGYTDLRVDARDSAATQARSIYKFDGTKYREASARIVNLQTGESKPASRRVQFRRGASSATLQGRVSLELSDQWRVSARAGQVMTVEVTSPRNAVTFMLMTSRTKSLADNTRSWTGTLPETGDYLILVESGDKPSTYSMTITIK